MTLSKVFVASATASNKNQFQRAVIKLAAMYTLVFGVIVLTLSIVLFTLFAGDIHEDMSAVWAPGSQQTRIIDYHKGILLRFVIAIDSFLMLTVTLCSYYLAKLTLSPIQRNYDAQKRFIADASHELRTPLAILKTDMEITLDQPKLPSSTKQMLNSYLEETNKMTSMVNDLLLLSKFDSSQISIKPEEIDLSDYLKYVIEKIKTLATPKKIKIDYSSDKKIIANIDRNLFEQAIRNVIKNAIEYSPTKSIITISLKSSRSRAIIEVQDQGVGMAQSEAERIFERFYRGEGTKKQKVEGAGLGMAITQEIIKKHNGTISVVSRVGKGTKIILEIPKI